MLLRYVPAYLPSALHENMFCSAVNISTQNIVIILGFHEFPNKIFLRWVDWEAARMVPNAGECSRHTVQVTFLVAKEHFRSCFFFICVEPNAGARIPEIAYYISGSI